MTLVKENNGFELVHAYRDDEDHFIGGKDGIFWYVVMKNNKTKETLVGRCVDGVWKDTRIKGSGDRKKTEKTTPGSTIRRIAEKAYLMQDEKWVKDRKGTLIQEGHPRRHYVYGFGDKGLDISEQYGVTITYSDIHDVPAGFHLRDLRTGNDVELPDGM